MTTVAKITKINTFIRESCQQHFPSNQENKKSSVKVMTNKGKSFPSVCEPFILSGGDRGSCCLVSFTCGGWRVVTFQAAVCKIMILLFVLLLYKIVVY